MYVEEYKVKPGKCLIIDNTSLSGGLELLPEGGNTDQEMLLLLFTGLGFEVETYRNLTADQIFQVTLKYICQMDHKGSFVFIVLSQQGLDSDVVYGVDGKEVHHLAIMECLESNEHLSLLGVPKIFIFHTTYSVGVDEASLLPQYYSYIQHPDDTVLITACSPIPSSGVSGSFMSMQENKFTRNLKAAIGEAEENHDFLTILEKVKEKCGNHNFSMEETLKRKYYIKR